MKQSNKVGPIKLNEVFDMPTPELHGLKLRPFEQGYLAFKTGNNADENPFDKDSAPRSRGRWSEGWETAKRIVRMKP